MITDTGIVSPSPCLLALHTDIQATSYTNHSSTDHTPAVEGKAVAHQDNSACSSAKYCAPVWNKMGELINSNHDMRFCMN